MLLPSKGHVRAICSGSWQFPSLPVKHQTKETQLPKRAHVPGRHFKLCKTEAILDSPMYHEDWFMSMKGNLWKMTRGATYVSDNGLVTWTMVSHSHELSLPKKSFSNGASGFLLVLIKRPIISLEGCRGSSWCSQECPLGNEHQAVGKEYVSLQKSFQSFQKTAMFLRALNCSV